MEITEAQFQQIEHCLPRQRGNVSLSNLQVLNAILYVAEHGCKWRGLPRRFGRWHTIYTRMNRWSRNGVLDRVFTELQRAQIVRIKIEAVSLDSTMVKVHPDGTGAQKNGPQAIGKSRGEWTTKIHMVAADARTAITFALSPGQAGDAPPGASLATKPWAA
jgi:transposase